MSREPIRVTPDHLQAILHELTALEPLFHSAHAEATTERFAQLVAPDFWEVGASGHRYSRDFALQVLRERSRQPAASEWQMSDLHVTEAGPGHYLLTYTLQQPGRMTHRLSVWRRSACGWQVSYHQGTVVLDAPWQPPTSA